MPQINSDNETLEELRFISIKSHEPMTSIISQYVHALYKLIREARPDSERISLTTFEMDLATGTIRQGFANIFGITELPLHIQNFYRLLTTVENIELSGRHPTFEELVTLGYSPEEVKKVLAERQPQQSPTVEPEKPKRKSFCEQLNEQHEKEISQDKENENV